MSLSRERQLSHRNAGDLGDGLHLLDAADVDLRDPEGAGHVGPLLSALGGLHRAAAVRAQLALGLDAEGAGAAVPRAGGDVGDAVARLVDADATLLAEHHLVALFGVGLGRLKLEIIELELERSDEI